MKYTLKQLNDMPTIEQGHFDNLKIDQDHMLRVWLSRMTTADGMPYNNQVTHKTLIDGVWVTSKQYEAKR